MFEDEVQIVEPEISESTVSTKKSDGTKQKSGLEQQKLTSMAAKLKKSGQDMTLPKLGRDLTAAEQRKLDSATVQPKFSRTTVAPPVPSSSKLQLSNQHNIQPTSISSDSSDSSSSEDEGAKVLVELAKKHAAPKKPEERRQVKMLDAPMTGKYQRVLQRNSGMDESRRTALRLKPDISSLHRRILSWNYDHDGPQPPGEPLKLFRVPDEFTHARHYRDVFDPLLLLECWAQIQQSKEADEAKFEVRIVGRQYADCWVDLDIVLNEGVTKDWNLSETDIVLLRHPTSKNCRLLKVQQFKQIPTGLSATLRMLSNAGDAGPQVDSLWMLNKVFRYAHIVLLYYTVLTIIPV
jgi:senataxin